LPQATIVSAKKRTSASAIVGVAIVCGLLIVVFLVLSFAARQRADEAKSRGDAVIAEAKRLDAQDEERQAAVERHLRAEPVTTIIAPELWTAFDGNELSADKMYTGKVIRVTGSVNIVRKDTNGKYYVGLGVFAPSSEPHVACYPAESKLKDFAIVALNGKVSIIGVCRGRFSAPNLRGGFAVVLEDCRLE
jgi:hypothetical protein